MPKTDNFCEMLEKLKNWTEIFKNRVQAHTDNFTIVSDYYNGRRDDEFKFWGDLPG